MSAIPDGLPRLKIHVLGPEEGEDGVPLTDVGVVNVNGERHLFLSPQSFDSAVRQVSLVMPELPLEQVERLVREHCTEFKDFDELLGSGESALPVDAPPSLAEPRQPSSTPHGRARKWAIAAALIPALAGSWAVGHFTDIGKAGMAASAPDGSTGATDVSDKRRNGKNEVEPFVDPTFRYFSDAGKINCSAIDNLEAECTDSDGMVMATKAATGPDSTIFMFSYGKERIGLRIFGDADYAATWSKQEASRQLYPNMTRSGRYVLWGTDTGRLNEYLKLLHAAPATSVSTAHAMGGADPLPPRLAALTLGTLGLDVDDVRTILSAQQDPLIDTPVLMAAQAVLGVNDNTPAREGGDGSDIVALAAGIDVPPVVVVDPDQNTQVKPGGVVQVTDPTPVGSTPTSGSGAQDTETVVPRLDPAPVPKTDEGEQPKPDEKKPEPTPTATPDPVIAKPIEQVQPRVPAQPTAPEQPTAPVDPGSPTVEQPTTSEQPDPSVPQPPAEGEGAAVELPVTAGNPDTLETGEQDTDGELLTLPQAWIASAA
ncbi:hypothetical protein [Streptomyces sp. NPDC050485]|uniref:hypothetical protein n=1 Tax=Streptomyces sp. NPDC050485 TaxID=3365617 RepID=UPI00378B0B66